MLGTAYLERITWQNNFFYLLQHDHCFSLHTHKIAPYIHIFCHRLILLDYCRKHLHLVNLTRPFSWSQTLSVGWNQMKFKAWLQQGHWSHQLLHISEHGRNIKVLIFSSSSPINAALVLIKQSKFAVYNDACPKALLTFFFFQQLSKRRAPVH